MSKISLNDSLCSAYSVVNDTVIGIKSSVMNVCSDIDRYFRLMFNLNVTDSLFDYEFDKVKRIFPRLSDMSIWQFNRLLEVFNNIRNVNAHLYLCKSIQIDEDIEEYLSNIVEPTYPISVNGELTTYGQAYILCFLSQKYILWPFFTSYFKCSNFGEICNLGGKGMSDFQVAEQHKIQNYCGIGKPIYPDNKKSMDWQFMNDLFKKHMTKIVFQFEKEAINAEQPTEYSWSLLEGLKKSNMFSKNKEVLHLIVFLRNCWFHGNNLNDEIIYNRTNQKFDYNFVFNSFYKIKNCLLKTKSFKSVLKELNNFASSSINFYCLRLVEVSYKILDNRLLTEDKLDSRFDNIETAYTRFLNTDKDFYKLSCKLVEPDDLLFSISASKFLDNVPRKTKCRDLKIININSKNGFDIGGFHTDKTNITLASIALNKDFQNKINGHYLDEYILINEEKYGNRISTFTVREEA